MSANGFFPTVLINPFFRLKVYMNKLHAHQLSMAHQIARLSAKALKQHQAHLLCNSLSRMLGGKK